MLNFLYCFDKNYNLQALNSINSLLSNCDEEVNIFIIHKDGVSFNKYLKYITNCKSKENIKIYKFKNKNINFPKLEGAHVSEATYYRMFIKDYLPHDLDYLIYLDADILCLNNPIKALNHEINLLKKDNLPLGAKTEGTRKDSPELFEKLGLINDNHFNAGMIIIDFQYWLNKDTENQLINILEKQFHKIVYWDQDILNIYFDDNYLKINNYLNFNHSVFNTTIIDNETFSKILFLHYSGKEKPWDVDNINNINSTYYQNSFYDLKLFKYHINFKINKRTLKNFVEFLTKFEFLKLKFPYSFLYLSFKSLLINLFLRQFSRIKN